MNEVLMNDKCMAIVVERLSSNIHSKMYYFNTMDHDNSLVRDTVRKELNDLRETLACFVGADNVARTVEEYDDRINGRV